jgi:tetratricopeptide (TPR) repeat protein
MKRYFLIAGLALAFSAGRAADLGSEYAIGRSYYQNGDYKKAVAHFELALRGDSNNAEIHYWAGMSYQRLSDIATPFGGKYNAKALACLTRAVDLDPGRADYRGELFDFLLDSAWASPRTLRMAAAVLRNTSQLDPEYDTMQHRLQQEMSASTSAGARLTRLTLAAPRTLERAVEFPAGWIIRTPER